MSIKVITRTMKFPSTIVIAFSITVLIFIIAGIAKVGSSNEIAFSEEFKSKDWIVDNIAVNSSETIYLDGNLIIGETGNLTLDNVTLIFNCTSDGEYHIEIENGGELYICNNSTITANTKSPYLFWVRDGAKLTMENSNLRYCGYKGTSELDYGLYICSSNVLIRNCILEENNWGVYYLQRTCQAGKARIENNNIINNAHGISVYGGGYYCANPYIANNTISFSSYGDGIYCRCDSSEIINNTISDNHGNGIFCDDQSHARIENNTLLSNGWNGIEVAAGSCIEKITGNKIENSKYGIYCHSVSVAATTSISNLAENTILNGSEGIYCAGSAVDNICNNTIINLSSCGIHIIRARSECNISWNNITECSIGIYCDDTDFTPENKTITHNSISFSTHSGLYCRYSSPQVIAGNGFSNNQLAINFSGTTAEVDYLNNTFENNIEGVLLQEWHLEVNVRVDGESVADAQVTVRDHNGDKVLEANTVAAGYADGYVAEYKILNNGTRVNYTPHTITGYKQYVGNATKVVSITDNGEETLDLTIPELYPEKIVVSGFLSEGQALTVEVVVVNNGTAAAENVTVRFLCDNLSIANQSISFIAAGRNETTSITWSAVKSAHLFEVQVNPDNLIEERANEIQNNNITQFISINAKPLAVIVGGPLEVYTYGDVTFYANGSYDPEGGISGITEYYFEFGDGCNKHTTDCVVKHNYTHKGIYNATVKVKDNFGVSAESDWSSIVQVTVQNRPPVANISASKNQTYTYEEIIFYATGSYDGEEPYELLYGEADHRIIKYYWDFGDNSSSVTINSIVSHSYTDNGNYTVTLIVQDDDLDNSTVKTFSTVSVRILNRMPTASFIVTPGIASVNDKLQFNASFAEDLDGEIINYTWDFGDGSKGYSTVCEHSYTQAGLYMVVLTVFDDDGANSTYVLVVDIKPLPTWIELHYKEVYLVGAIFCILGAIFFSLRWYEEAKRKEKEVKLWAEKKGAEKEIKIEEEVGEWAEKKKKLKTIDERIKEWAKKREAAKKVKEEKLEEWAKKREKEKVEKELTEWAAKKEAKKKK